LISGFDFVGGGDREEELLHSRDDTDDDNDEDDGLNELLTSLSSTISMLLLVTSTCATKGTTWSVKFRHRFDLSNLALLSFSLMGYGKFKLSL